jgi:hypothetical protein
LDIRTSRPAQRKLYFPVHKERRIKVKEYSHSFEMQLQYIGFEGLNNRSMDTIKAALATNVSNFKNRNATEI